MLETTQAQGAQLQALRDQITQAVADCQDVTLLDLVYKLIITEEGQA